MKKKLFLTCALTLFAFDVCAENLIDAFVMTYQSNPELKSERAKLKTLDENLSQANSSFRPKVSLVSDISHVDSELELESGVKSDSNRQPYGASVVLNQSLFSGFESVASKKSAENLIKAGRFSLVSKEQDLLLETAKAYMSVVHADASLGLNFNKEQVYKKHVDEAKKRYEIGEITITDYSQSEARYEGAKAERISAEGLLENAKAYYQSVTGAFPENLDKNVTPPSEMILSEFDDVLNIALKENPLIKMSMFSEKSARNDVAKSGSGLLPSLDGRLSGTYGENQQYKNDEYKELKATATLNIPLYEGGLYYSKVRQAKEIANQKRLDTEALRLDIKKSVTETWQNLNAIKARIKAYDSQIKAYEVALLSMEKEWEIGTKTIIDVMDAEQDLLDAKLNMVTAKRDEVVESFSLISLTGGLLLSNFDVAINLYNPLENYDKVKNKWIGTGESNK